MATIYKYPIPKASEPFELKIKGFCEVVHVGLDGNDTPCLWAIVNPNMPEESWKYLIVATGQEFDVGKWCHVKTFTQGQFVWHLLRPLDDWNRDSHKDAPVGSLVYIIATKRKQGLPGIEKAMDGRFYYTYAEAEAARQLLSDDLKAACAVFSIHAVIQQEVTFEALF